MEGHQPLEVVCVTGATGYLAGHIICQLIDAGCQVHGTVRSLEPGKYEKRVAHLVQHAKEKGAEHLLKFFAADLTVEGSFREAVRGCTAVVHTANVVQLSAKDPQRDIVEPSVKGLLSVLDAMDAELKETEGKKKGLRTFVLTSSYASVEVGIPEVARGPLTEDDWNTKASLQWKPYSFSKVETERAARAWCEKIAFERHKKKVERKEEDDDDEDEDEDLFRYCSIHPPMIIGPQLNGDSVQSSSEAISLILSGQYPLLPPLWFPMVDVRDVARVHVECILHKRKKKGGKKMEEEEKDEETETTDKGMRYLDGISGRYLVCNGHNWLMDLANYAREVYGDQYPIPRRTLPVWLFKLVGRFDSRLDAGVLQENTQEGLHVDASKVCKVLNFNYQYDTRQSMLDHCESLIQHQLVGKKK